jgi:hypothetical protein
MRRRAGRWATVAGILGLPGLASADITTELSASILVFPKIIADGSRDTHIQITNTSNSLVRAHCFYVNAAPTDPTRPPGPLNPPLWLEVDFTIQLTKQQPTQWSVTEGRSVNPFDPICFEGDCSEAGIDPGRIPPVVPDFVGELKCVEVDDSGSPLSGNHLKGEATLISFEDVRVISQDPLVEEVFEGSSKYNAIGVLGEENNGDGTLVLGGGQCSGTGSICSNDDDCGSEGPCVLEYNACPETWILNHLADGAPNLVLENTPLEGNSRVDTTLTVVPCTQNFETQIPTTVTLQLLTFNEFESQFSVSTSVTCWGNFTLGSIGAPALTFEGQFPDPQGTVYLQTRFRSAAGSPYGVFMVAEEAHLTKPFRVATSTEQTFFGTRAAVNLHVEGSRPVPDVITGPDDQLEP